MPRSMRHARMRQRRSRICSWRRATRSGVRGSWLLAIVLVVACKHAAQEGDEEKPAAASVTCAAVEGGDIDELVEVSGVIAPPPKLDAVVSSPIAGRVGQVLV